MKGVLYKGCSILQATGLGRGGVWAFGFIAVYLTLTIGCVLFDFSGMRAALSKPEWYAAYYAPLIAVSGSYLAVLIKRAVCLYLAKNVDDKFSIKNIIELITMGLIISASCIRMQMHLELAPHQHIHAIIILICIFIGGSAVMIQRKKTKPFVQNLVEVKFDDWYLQKNYVCLIPQRKYKFAMNCISHSYFVIAVALMTTVFVL